MFNCSQKFQRIIPKLLVMLLILFLLLVTPLTQSKSLSFCSFHLHPKFRAPSSYKTDVTKDIKIEKRRHTNTSAKNVVLVVFVIIVVVNVIFDVDVVVIHPISIRK